MEHESFILAIEGNAIDKLYPDLISLEVELDDELASMFRLRLATSLQSDGTWLYLDDEQLTPWKKVTIDAGFVESGVEELFSGYVTHVRPTFDPNPTRCTLEIWGMDGSVLMDQEEKLKAWPNKKDSDIVSEIFFDLYGFIPVVEDTQVVHDETISTIIQRETDMQFLRRLALRNGFECFVEGDTGYFRPPQVDAPPQPVLAVHCRNETNVGAFSIEVNALTPANVTTFQIDRVNKEILEATIQAGQQTVLGKVDAAGLLASGVSPGQVFTDTNTATGNPEMMALCQGLYDRATWFVTGEGEIGGNHYGHVLRPRGTVTIKGVGETYSGVYYVTHVTHTFTRDGYIQHFRVKRNALLPTGTEDFSSRPLVIEV